jgi:hypothetical protein
VCSGILRLVEKLERSFVFLCFECCGVLERSVCVLVICAFWKALEVCILVV